MKTLFLVPYPPNESPSQRFRFEQYFEALTAAGFAITVQSFLGRRGWNAFYTSRNVFSRLVSVFWGLCKRMSVLFTLSTYDFVFIHREVSPLGPPFFEWLIARVFRKKIIYDFDDAIWLTDRTEEGEIEKAIRWRAKTGLICKWSYRISCGNAFLANYAAQFNQNVVINPTTIDTIRLHNVTKEQVARISNDSAICIGWTGSHSTLKYLKLIESVIQKLSPVFPNIQLLVIADRAPEIMVPNLKFTKWNKDTEIADLLKIDIGIMPLPDDEWSKGKCGFKLLQYMAVGIPAVASAVGENCAIINGRNGLLAKNEAEWITHLTELISNPSLRAEMGRAGREFVEANYSVVSNTANFLSLFD